MEPPIGRMGLLARVPAATLPFRSGPGNMVIHYAILLAGILCAAAGGELFVRGAIGISRSLRVAPGIIGATVAAFATSSPELSVSLQAAMHGRPEISLGDALGSNVVNVALVLGAALSISGIKASKDTFKRDYPWALAVPVLTVLLSLDGILSRGDGAILFAAFLAWLALIIRAARKQRRASQGAPAPARPGAAVAVSLVGLVFLAAAGALVVAGARAIAVRYGIGEFVIGATMVAVGTSMPELATTIISKLRGHEDVGIGTVLGSNIFNGLVIVALAAILCPIRVSWREVTVACAFGLAAILMIWPSRDGTISRIRGIALILLYGAYLTMVLGRA